jgi:hypothetical protein
MGRGGKKRERERAQTKTKQLVAGQVLRTTHSAALSRTCQLHTYSPNHTLTNG